MPGEARHAPATLRGLLARLEAVDAADGDLDEAIHFTILPDDPWGRAILKGRSLVKDGQSGVEFDLPGVRDRMTAWAWATCAKVPAYTASIDAAVALADRRGFGWQVDRDQGCILSDADDCYDPVKAATPPLSVCAALCRALLAMPSEINNA